MILPRRWRQTMLTTGRSGGAPPLSAFYSLFITASEKKKSFPVPYTTHEWYEV
jgi:hypothetical protein